MCGNENSKIFNEEFYKNNQKMMVKSSNLELGALINSQKTRGSLSDSQGTSSLKGSLFGSLAQTQLIGDAIVLEREHLDYFKLEESNRVNLFKRHLICQKPVQK